MTDIEGTDLFKKIKAYNEKSRKEEEQKREEIAEKENSDPFRKIPEQGKYWIRRYLSLTGIMRNRYGQIVDKCKRLSAMQISHIMKEVHCFDVSPEAIGKFKKHLIENGELLSDEEFQKNRPSEEELGKIRKDGARATAIERSKEKIHLDPKELEGILERRKERKN